jgi:hypothetical protein
VPVRFLRPLSQRRNHEVTRAQFRSLWCSAAAPSLQHRWRLPASIIRYNRLPRRKSATGCARRTAFDVGEYLLGTYAQNLKVGKDVPDNASFLNATFATDSGNTVNLQNSLAVYEKFSGLAWTRTDPTTAARDTRGARSLVLTWNAWIGNYIYGFDWVLSQDGVPKWSSTPVAPH